MPRIAALALLACCTISCRNAHPPSIDPAVAQCIPPGAVILGGVNLDRLRASPLQQHLPPAAAAFLEPLHDVNTLVLASNGTDWLALLRGSFREAPAGGTILAAGLAASGSPKWVEMAQQQHRSAPSLRPGLLEQAESLAANSEIWAAVAGAASLPLSGNGDNFNRLLHATQYTTLSVKLGTDVAVEILGTCGSADLAQRLEGTVRAMTHLGSAATATSDPALAGLLRRTQVSTSDRTVQVTLSAAGTELPGLFKLF